MLHRMAVIASLALTVAQPVAAQQDGAANVVQSIQKCVRRLDRYFVPDPEHAGQKRLPGGMYHVAFQADRAGLIRSDGVRVTSQDAANQPHDRAAGRALGRCLDHVQDGAAPSRTEDELQPYILPMGIVDARDMTGQPPSRGYFPTDTEYVIVTLLLVTMPAIGALPFAVTNR